MSNVRFSFYSDTNIGNAIDELQLMSIDTQKEGDTLLIQREDYDAMGDSIETIVQSNGGELAE